MGERIYLDNASTTFPKPPIVAKAVYSYMTEAGTNIGRGDYSSAYGVEDAVFETRELICGLMGGEDPSQVVFTRNVTESINLLLKGYLDGSLTASDVEMAYRGDLRSRALLI